MRSERAAIASKAIAPCETPLSARLRSGVAGPPLHRRDADGPQQVIALRAVPFGESPATWVAPRVRQDLKGSRCTPQVITPGCAAGAFNPVPPMIVSQMALAFAVSRDEEHVAVEAQCGGARIHFGIRAHHYLLLTLARQRRRDSDAGLPETSCGWVDVDELHLDAGTSSARVNIDVFRVRRQFEALGVIDGREVVERRPRARQLRIGVARITITSL